MPHHSSPSLIFSFDSPLFSCYSPRRPGFSDCSPITSRFVLTPCRLSLPVFHVFFSYSVLLPVLCVLLLRLATRCPCYHLYIYAPLLFLLFFLSVSASIVRLFLGTHLPSNMDITDISALLPFLRKFLLLASLQVACNESAHAIRRWRISVFLLLSPCLYFITASLLTIYSILPPVSTFLYIIIVSVNSIAFFMDTHWTFKLFLVATIITCTTFMIFLIFFACNAMKY